ncbi:uncharacterized protein LOC124872310 isoform X2 [Girardinichthys multiradiatus]|uniref:uncharacterized protein LOC124872310 isoform X2 n=1 Tax=Girardinichthys multiradiatus TaxID=208333 RepID=UPI001FAE423D|nr:uncharacterized protein LOC124872310 isoform X2 [Girardinichthys multiradiatus]
MKVCHTLISLFFLTLQEGETVRTYTRKEGGSITVRCEFSYYGNRRFLCKETCKGKNILIETTKDRTQTGRYSIRYEGRDKLSSDFLHVSITELEKSDSGRYRCGLVTVWAGTLYDDFRLVVKEDPSEPRWTLGPFIRSTFLPAASTTKTPQSLSSSPSPSSSDTNKLSEKPAAASGLLLYVGLTLAILIFMLAAALLIFYKRKSFSQQKGPPVETENGNVSKAEDEAVEYSEVHFLNITTSPNSAPCCHADNATYSELQVAVSSTNHSNDFPLYSNITLQQ